MKNVDSHLSEQTLEYFSEIFDSPVKEEPKFIDVSEYESIDTNESSYVAAPDDLDYVEFMESLVDPLTGTLRDFRIDDRSLPVAKNFYDYCMNINKGEINIPWARQLIAAETFLGEICPRCSNKKYLDPLDVPKDFVPEDLKHPKRLVFLENGVCPQCGLTKKQINQMNLLPRYTQGVFVWGQRCVSADTLLLTDQGMVSIGRLLQNQSREYDSFKCNIYNGERLEQSSQSFITVHEESLYRLTLEDGGVIECTGDHPLMTQDGWKTAKDISTQDSLQISIGSNCFGKYRPKDEEIRSLNLHADSVPELVLKSDMHVSSHYLTHLFLTLGFPKKRSICINVSNAQFAQELRAIAYNLGIEPIVIRRRTKQESYLFLLERAEYTKLIKLYCSFSNQIELRSKFCRIATIERTEPKLAYDLVMPETHRFVGNSIINHNSGKSSTAASIASYTLHRYLKYPMLAELAPRMMQKSTQLTGIFCSLTFKKAVDVLWIPFRNIILTSEWFGNYFELLEDYKRQTGIKLLINSTTKLAIGNKNILCFPTGPRASTLRGNTSFMCYLDELGLFPMPKKEDDDDVNRQASPDEAYTSLLNSLVTVTSTADALVDKGYYSVPPSYILSVSSPVSSRDKVMRLLKDSEKDTTIYPSHLPTWEVNPGLERNKGLIASKFINDPEAAMRDFGAQPSDIAFSYFNFDDCAKLFVGSPLTHTFKQRMIDDELFCTVTQANHVSYPCIMSLDAGYVNNSFAVTVMYYDTERDKTRLASIVECMPVKGKTINFAKMYEHVILPLAKDLNVCYVVADRWNSIDLLHRLKHDMGNNPKGKPYVRADMYSLKRKDFESFKLAIANQSIELPKLKDDAIKEIRAGITGDYRKIMYGRPVNHLLLQMSTVVDVGIGQCPDKAPGLTDDILRAFVLGVTKLQTEKVANRLLEFKDYIRRENTERIIYKPIVLGRSGFNR